MDVEKVNVLLDKYVARFDALVKQEEYKWRAPQKFHDSWQPNAEDYPGMLRCAFGGLGNITDARGTSPRQGVVVFAQQEPDSVRQMFCDLFRAGNLGVRVDRFIADSDILLEKYGKWYHRQTPSAVMAYLTCWKPDEYFFFKTAEARKFASFVEFEADWGTMNSFKPEVYCDMCNQLIRIMQQHQTLLRVNKKRFADNGQRLWPDESLHILAYDVIFCSFAPMYNGMS